MLSARPLVRPLLLETPGRPLQLPMDVDPVLVVIIASLLVVVFLLFLLVRRTVKSFAEGMREGRR